MTIPEFASENGLVITAELTPPKGARYEDALELAEDMAQFVDAINVTDGQSAVMRMGPLALCHLLAERRVEPVFQVTCRDRNRIALQSEMLNAFALGIRNVLCLTGDHVALGDHPDAKQVFDLDSVSLLCAVQNLNEGRDLRGNALKGATGLCAGAVVNPNASPAELQLLKMRRKIRAGARFFQTQPVFEVSRLDPFARMAKEMKVPMLMGVMVLTTAAGARFVQERVSGVRVPGEIMSELARSEDPLRTGIAMAAKLIQKARGLCAGVHIMNVREKGLMKRILEGAGIKRHAR